MVKRGSNRWSGFQRAGAISPGLLGGDDTPWAGQGVWTRPRPLVAVLVLCSTLVAQVAEGAGRSVTCHDLEPGRGEPAWCAALNPAKVGDPAAGKTPLAPADTAWGWDYFSGNLGPHPLNDFPAFSAVGSNLGDLYALDFDPTATTLYALDSATMQLGTLSLVNASFSAIGPSVPTQPGQDLWSGMTIDPVSGTIYASAIAGAVNVPYGLYTIDAGTGAATLVGTDPASTAMIDIAINCGGEMYGHDIVTDSIYQIEPSDGSVTLIGPTGVDSNFAQGLDFDNEAGVLYAWTYQGGGANQFGTINLTTGALTPLFSSNPTGEWIGAVQNVCASNLVFADGFENGTTSAWSTTVP